MLTQMENFEGVLICATNLIEDIDPAALRRFDLKVHFDYLTAPQAWALFQRQCILLDLPFAADSVRNALQQISTLTPGDFAAVARQHRFKKILSAEHMLAALQNEIRSKDYYQHRKIGFI